MRLARKENKKQIMAEFTNMYKLIFDHTVVSSRQSVDSSQGSTQLSQQSVVETGSYIRKFGQVSIIHAAISVAIKN